MPTITDWIVALCTFVYVIATIVIMSANRKSANMAEKQMQEERNQFEKQQRLSVRPYLNLYVARNGEVIDKNKHYSIAIDKESEMNCKNNREISIRNIGNGSAKDIKIEITVQGNAVLNKKNPVRNGILLVNKQYVFNLHYDKFENISLCCYFTDLYDNKYSQKMEISYDMEKDDIISHTHNPDYIPD